MGSKKRRSARGIAAMTLSVIAIGAAGRQAIAQCAPPIVRVNGPAGAVNFGKNVVSLGDINGDGYDDYAVGDPDYRGGDGRVSIYHGGTNVVYATIPGTSGGRAGTALAVSGNRFVVGVPGDAGDRGRVWTFRLPSLGVTGTYVGATPGDRFGHALTGVGDLDADGLDDFAVGIPGYASGSGRVEVIRSTTPFHWARTGLFSSGSFGSSLAAGDVDGDGATELVVGSPTLNVTTRVGAGRVSICEIRSGLPRASFVNGGVANDGFGSRVATIKQGDGADAWVGVAPGASTMGGGRAEIHRPSGRAATLTGLGSYYFGTSLANAGDWNEDGYDELLIGSTGAIVAPPAAPPGEVRLIDGRTFALHYQHRGPSQVGSSVAMLLDSNGDKMPKIIAGAPDGSVTRGHAEILQPRVAPARAAVMLTEVAWVGSACVELTNFGPTPVDLSGWRVRWSNVSGTGTSAPIDTTILPGESIVLSRGNPNCPTSGARVLSKLIVPTGYGSGTQVIGLFNSKDCALDEVRLGSASLAPLIKRFRGYALRLAGTVAIERYWGLDSNSGGDWSSQRTNSLGLESRSSGPRGVDPVAVCDVVINETSDAPDLVELRNKEQGAVDIQGWSLLVSGRQCQAQQPIAPWFGSTIVPGNGFYVVGEGPPPAEKPSSVGYVDIQALGLDIPWNSGEYSCALYDGYGRQVDLMITTNEDALLRHNHPRAPYPMFALTGTAPRASSAGIIGRNTVSFDSDSGSDWFAISTRTMGAPNFPSTTAGHAQSLDARLSHGPTDGGFTLIINAGGSAANGNWGMLYSLTRCRGTGPRPLGLCAPVVDTWGTASLYGLLDDFGSTRLDFGGGTMLCTVGLELLVYVITPGGGRYTRVLDYTPCGCP